MTKKIAAVPILVFALAMLLSNQISATAALSSSGDNPKIASQPGASMAGSSEPMRLAQAQGKPAAYYHPIIRASITIIQVANNLLKNEAAHDFQGHKRNAIQHLNNALQELNECLEIQ